MRAGDRVYVCDTGRGAVLELAFPSMKLVRVFALLCVLFWVHIVASTTTAAVAAAAS